ncbi:MAG TPA: ABC transporter substrate-binding protein [Chloroflexi bacterium]|nr:ABC transporter substrate-binding protein [Chloroflexota bacterium]
MFLTRKGSLLSAATVCTLVLSLVLGACAPQETPIPPTEAPPEAPTEAPPEDTPVPEPLPSKYNEAPMLAEMVAAGELPVVDERLPEEPMIVEPIESIGEYGGIWHRAFLGVKDFHALGRLIYEAVLRWPRDPKDPIQPGLAKDWKWSEDGTELTLYFREGLKWSDGAPFTVDDVIFWWEDIELDENITPAPHSEWVVNGEPMELEKIDDTTIKLKFAGPNGLAESIGLAFHGCQWPLGFERFGFFAPRHYLEQFHPKYNPEADYDIFEEKAFNFNTELPVMYAWRVSQWEAGATEMAAERNPYYWKVDPEGNQLPYIDRIHFTLVEDNEAVNMMAIAGELDMQHRRIDFAKYTVYQENAEAGDYHLLMWSTAQASTITLFPNQSYPDPTYRELMQNLKFRQALSLAIDRDMINDVAFLGQGIPRTISVVRSSPLFQEDIETYYAEHDPDAAQVLLEEIGLVKGGDGFYTFEDGTPVELIVEATDAVSGASMDALELVVEEWNSIGLKTVLQTMSRDIYWPRATANEVMIATWETDRGLVPMVDPIYQFPFDDRSWMGPAFGMWYKTGGELGEESPAHLKEVQDLYDQYKSSVDPDEQLEIAKEIVRKSTEGLFTIGTVGMTPGLVVVKNNFHNVMKEHTSDWLVFTPGTQDPPQFWIER